MNQNRPWQLRVMIRIQSLLEQIFTPLIINEVFLQYTTSDFCVKYVPLPRHRPQFFLLLLSEE